VAKTFGDDCDWRGTKIEVGQLVIYGAPVGRSIAMVQGIVDGFTPAGRVWVKVVHRAYGGWGGADAKDRVHVGNDRLTVLNKDGLPPTTLPTEGDKKAEAVAKEELREQNRATHTRPSQPPRPNRKAVKYQDQTRVNHHQTVGQKVYDADYLAYANAPYANCVKCGAKSWDQTQAVCPGA
jgi:hypothetical protein